MSNLTQTTTGLEPVDDGALINGLRTIQFDSVDEFMNGPQGGDQGGFFAVVEFDNFTGQHYVAGFGDRTQVGLGVSSNASSGVIRIEHTDGTIARTTVGTVPMPLETPVIIRCRWDITGTVEVSWTDGTNGDTITRSLTELSTLGTNNYRIGSGFSPANLLAGRIGRLAIYDTRPDDTAWDAGEAELIDEWISAPPPAGTYESVVSGLDPAVYLKFANNLTGSAGVRNGVLGGTGGAFVTAIAPGVGEGNAAFNTQGTAFVTVAHAAADTALTTTYASPWDGDHTGNRFIADVTISIWFKANALPTGSNKAVIFSKSHTATPGDSSSFFETHHALATAGSTVSGGSFEAYLDANGAIHIEVRSFRGRHARISTPDGAVTTGTPYHLTVQLAYDGVAAWLDGAKLEDGFGNLMHNYGLAADILGVVYRNDYDWMIGKAAWGGQADVIVDEFAIYLSTLTQANAEALAQVGPTGPLTHPIWGAQTVNESAFANINAAITSVNGSGGGTVLVNSGTYNENVTLLSNVRLKTTGSVTINGTLRAATVSTTSLGAGTGTLAIGGKTLTTNNSASAGQVVHISGPSTNPSPLRTDRRWNTEAESNDPNFPDGEAFVIQSRDASSITFEGGGAFFEFTAANRAVVNHFTPTSDIAVEGDFTFNTASPIRLERVLRGRFIGLTTTTTANNGQNFNILNDSLEIQVRDCEIFQSTDPATPAGTNDGFRVTQASSDIVFKDCICHDGHHAADITGSPGFGPGARAEWHNTTWTTTARLSPTAWGTHGVSAFGIYWNLTSDWGGCSATGYKHDSRWQVNGTAASVSNQFVINDGAGDCWFRNIHCIRPGNYFAKGFGNDPGVDRCRFENITHSAAPTGLIQQDYNYGTAANVCTYTNVDNPSADWVED